MLKIGKEVKKVKAKKPTNLFKLLVSNMSGDADAYHETETFFKKEDEPILEELLKLFKWSVDKWPNRNQIEDRYNEIKGKYPDFFENLEDEEVVTRDSTCDGDVICRPYLTSITWFNENGKEFKVDHNG